MTTAIPASKKEKLKRASHILAGCIVLFHGYERWESGHGNPVYFFVAGVIFLVVAIFHHRIAAKFPFVDIIFFLLESMLSFVIAGEYFSAGKSALPFAYIIAGLIQLTGIYFFYRKMKTNTARH